jgi:hypothetical protein
LERVERRMRVGEIQSVDVQLAGGIELLLQQILRNAREQNTSGSRSQAQSV